MSDKYTEFLITKFINELRRMLTEKRGAQVVDYSCECCGTGYKWEPDPEGEYVRWSDIEEILK